MIEYILIKILLRFELYIKYGSYLKLDYYKNNNKEIYKIFLSLKKLHASSEKDASVDDLAMSFFSEYPHLKPDEVELYHAIFEKIRDAEVNEELCIEYLEQHRKQALAGEAAIFALEVSQGKRSWEDFITLVTKDEEDVVQEGVEFVTDDLEELYQSTVVSHGLRWRLKTLNAVLGSLRKGDFGFFFARPETGKTTLLASEITFMAGQTDAPIIWFNNEEQGSKVTLRCYQAALGCTVDELFADLKTNQEKYYEITKRNIKIYDDAAITKTTVEKICKQLNPAMIIFDQIDKIYGFEAERHDLKLKTIYQWARELSKMYGPVLAVCQAGGTGEGKKWLTMTDVDSSHTAKQGEADFILGVGATGNDGEEYMRYFSVCKNKLVGDEDSVPELRHAKVAVNILPEVARYADIMEF